MSINTTTNTTKNATKNTATNMTKNTTTNTTTNMITNMSTNTTTNMSTHTKTNMTINMTANVTANTTTNMTTNTTNNITSYTYQSPSCKTIQEAAFDSTSNMTYGIMTLQCYVENNSILDIEMEMYEQNLWNKKIALNIICASFESSIVTVPLYSCLPNLVYLQVEWCQVTERVDKKCRRLNESSSNPSLENESKLQVLHFIDVHFASNITCGMTPTLNVLSLISCTCDHCEYEHLSCFTFKNLPSTLQYATFYGNLWFTIEFVGTTNEDLFPPLKLLDLAFSLLSTKTTPVFNNELYAARHVSINFSNIVIVDLTFLDLLYYPYVIQYNDFRSFSASLIGVFERNLEFLKMQIIDKIAMKKLEHIFFNIQIGFCYIYCTALQKRANGSIKWDDIFKYDHFIDLKCVENNENNEKDEKDGYNVYQYLVIFLSVIFPQFLLVGIIVRVYQQELLIIIHNITLKMPWASCSMVNIFLIYDLNDQEFIESLMQQLDKAGNFKFILLERDFIAGSSEMTNIEDAIKFSQCAMYCCSVSSVQNEQCAFLFMMAYAKMVKERSHYLLTVLIDDISCLNDICQYLQATRDCKYPFNVLWFVKKCLTVHRNSCLFWYTLKYRLNTASKKLNISFVSIA